MASTPVIGITAGTAAAARPYADAIERNGGEPLLVLPDAAPSPESTLARVGGLLFSGGAGVHRAEHEGTHAPADQEAVSSSRDGLELPLLRAALDRDVPVLGICRGMQALNVVMGGTLRDVADHGSSAGDEQSSYHRVYIAPGSKLAAIVGSGGFVRVNSRHQRGVKETQKSPRLLASAYSLDDGVIEALESPEHDWVVGVQFHPERRMEVPPHFERLFQGLVQRANRVAAR